MTTGHTKMTGQRLILAFDFGTRRIGVAVGNELLASARMDEVIKELASRYEDRILIFDSPPILATTESVTLASHMGQIVFVVQAGRTKRDSVDSALELLGERQHLGLVLNRTTGGFGKSDFGAYYGSYYYGYGEGKEA